MEANERVDWLQLADVQRGLDALRAAELDAVALSAELRRLYAALFALVPTPERDQCMLAIEQRFDAAEVRARAELDRRLAAHQQARAAEAEAAAADRAAEDADAPEPLTSMGELRHSAKLLERWSLDWPATHFAELPRPQLDGRRSQQLARRPQAELRVATLEGDANAFLALLTKLPLRDVQRWLVRRLAQQARLAQTREQSLYCGLFLLASCQSAAMIRELRAELEPHVDCGMMEVSEPQRLAYKKNVS